MPRDRDDDVMEEAMKLVARLPRDPGDGGPNTMQTLLRQNSFLLAMLVICLSTKAAEETLDE